MLNYHRAILLAILKNNLEGVLKMLRIFFVIFSFKALKSLETCRFSISMRIKNSHTIAGSLVGAAPRLEPVCEVRRHHGFKRSGIDKVPV